MFHLLLLRCPAHCARLVLCATANTFPFGNSRLLLQISINRGNTRQIVIYDLPTYHTSIISIATQLHKALGRWLFFPPAPQNIKASTLAAGNYTPEGPSDATSIAWPIPISRDQQNKKESSPLGRHCAVTALCYWLPVPSIARWKSAFIKRHRGGNPPIPWNQGA